MKKQMPFKTLIAETPDSRFSLWISRDHDYPWLEYPRDTPVKCLGITTLESPALGRLLRELLDVCPLNIDVKKVRLQCGTTAEDEVLLIVSSGGIPVVAHIPKVATADEAKVFFAAMPSVPHMAIGDSLVSPGD